MKYFSFGMTNDDSLAFMDYFEGIEYYFDLYEGVRMGARCTPDASAYLDKQNGDFLTDYLSNTSKLVPISEKAKAVFESMGLDDTKVEYLPFKLYNKNQRLVTKQYYFANSLEKVGCIDLQRSQVSLGEGNTISKIKVLFVDQSKVPQHSCFFRLAEFPKLIVIREDLVEKLHAENITGLELVGEGERIW